MGASQQRTVLISGASAGGAGNALALEFAAKGFRVFATARSTKSLVNLEQKGIETLVLDVTSAESIASLKSEIAKRTGGTLDILFNNAGSLYEAPAVEADPARVRSMFDANVFGLFDMVTAFTPLLLAAVSKSNHKPTIINTASILARIPFPFSSAYNATKAAVAAYSDTLRLEVAPLGIKVVTIYMGEVSTALMMADNINFGSESMYIDVEHKIKERSINHARASMQPTEFARQVVQSLVEGRDDYIWKGTNAFIVWLLNAIGPRKVFDGNSLSGAGLNDKRARERIFKKGQHKVGQN